MREPTGTKGIHTTDVGKVFHFGPKRQAFRLVRNLRTGTLSFRRLKSEDGKASW